jgi:ATP-dependent Clp protease protease subunit
MEKKDIKNVNNVENTGNQEIIELDPEALEALMGGGIPVAQSFNYTWLDSFDMEDLEERRLYINGEVTDEIITDIGYHIMRYNRLDKGVDADKRTPVVIYLNTPGGSLHAANTIISLINSSTTPVYTVNLGMALSAGFLIFIAGHKRIAYPHASFLYHEGSTGMGGDAGKFRNFAAFYEKQLDELKAITLKYTKITEETYDQHVKDDWWLLAKEALELGICDEIATEL